MIFGEVEDVDPEWLKYLHQKNFDCAFYITKTHSKYIDLIIQAKCTTSNE